MKALELIDTNGMKMVLGLQELYQHLMVLEQQSVSDAHVAGLGAHGDQACPSPAWYPAQT